MTSLFATDHSMTRLSTALLLSAGFHRQRPWRRRHLHAGHVAHSTECGAQAGFRIHQESRRRDDSFTGCQSAKNFHPIFARSPDGNLSRDERAAGVADENETAFPGGQHRGSRNGECIRVLRTGDADRRVHAWFEAHVAVRHDDAHPDSTCCLAQRRIDVGDLTHTVLARQRLKIGVNGLAEVHRRNLLLEDFTLDPNGAEVRDFVECVAGHDLLAGKDIFLEHITAGGSNERQALPNDSRPLHLGDLALGNVPVCEPPSRRGEQVARASARVVTRAGDVALKTLREHELFLRRHEHRRVDAEQRLSRRDVLARGVHEELLHPSIDLQSDRTHARLVECHLTDGADVPRKWSEGDRGKGDSDPPRLFGGKRHGFRGILYGRGDGRALRARRRGCFTGAAGCDVCDSDSEYGHSRIKRDTREVVRALWPRVKERCHWLSPGRSVPTEAWLSPIEVESMSSLPISISNSAHAFPSSASSTYKSWRYLFTVIWLSSSVMKSTLPARYADSAEEAVASACGITVVR